MICDLRLALRAALREPGAFLVAVVSLGLGICAVTVAVAAADGLLWRPPPYDPNGELAFVGAVIDGRGGPSSPSSVPDFLDLREQARSMRLGAYRDGGVNLGREPAEWVNARRASAGFFETVGVAPVLGRTFVSDDESEGAADVAVLGHALWERRFGSDPEAIGRTIDVDGVPIPIVGVMPPRHAFSRGNPELWLPLHLSPTASREARSVQIVARVRDADLSRARAELASLGEALATLNPGTNAGRTFAADGVQSQLYGAPILQQALVGFMIATLMVLLIACANVANLLLARGVARSGELAVRRALGGSWWRIVRQLSAEALLLAAASAAAALILTPLAMSALLALMPGDLPRSGDAGMDVRVAVMTFLVACGSTLFFASVPIARTLGGTEAGAVTGSGSGSSRQTEPHRLRSGLVAAEIALAVVLVTSTALVVRSVSAIASVETGFTTEGVVVFDLSLPATAYPDEVAIRQALAGLAETTDSGSGVEAAGLAVGLPGRDWRSLPYVLPGEPPEEESSPMVVARIATPGYLDALGIEAVRGRLFGPADDEDSGDVVVVNLLLADRLWPNGDPVGQILNVGARSATVVGVAPAVREFGPTLATTAVVYLPLAQWPSRTVSVVLRASGSSEDLLSTVRSLVTRVDPALAPYGVATLDDVLMESAAQYTALRKVLVVLALVALLLALGGVFAASSYAVERRVREIGIRMALGAAPARIRSMVLGRTAVTAGVGLIIGTVLALGAARGITSFLFGVEPTDPATFIEVACLLLVVSLVAAWVPARRASAVDPMESLRADG